MSDPKHIQDRLAALRKTVDGKTDVRAAAENAIERIDGIIEQEKSQAAKDKIQQKHKQTVEKKSSGFSGLFASTGNKIVELAGPDSKLGHALSDSGEVVYKGGRVTRAVIQTCVWTAKTLLLPLLRYTILPIATWIIRRYTQFYQWLAYTTDENTGEERVHYPRSLATIIGSLIVAYWIVTSAIPFIGHLAYEATLYPTTLRAESMYMMGSEADATHAGVFYAKGCIDLNHCNDTHSIRYEIKHSNWLYIKNIFTKGTLFLPEYIDGAIPNVVAKCELETWGVRFRPLGLYPQISSVKRCVPLSDDEIQSLTTSFHPNRK